MNCGMLRRGGPSLTFYSFFCDLVAVKIACVRMYVSARVHFSVCAVAM